ncbi:MAG: serine hydrolase [Deinococcales bacterium]
MKLRHALRDLLGALALSGALAMSAQAQPLPTGALQAALAAAVASPDTRFQAAVLAVHRPGEPIWSGAAGTAELASGTPLTPDARFRAGSIAKPFVATVTLQLVEEGALALDAPITTLLPPEVTDRFPQASRVSVRMLLQHTGGIPEWIDGTVIDRIGRDPGRIWNVDEFLDLAAAKTPPFEPGHGWAYANTDYNLLGLIIERATGTSWREQVRQRIVEPLGLASTSLPEPGATAIVAPVMHGYGMVDGQLVDLTASDPSMAGAAGGSALVTTTTDLITFLDALRTAELFQDASTLTAMTTFVDARNPGGQTGYGLGLERYVFPGGFEAIGHSGSSPGYFAFVGYLPDLDVTIALAVDAMLDPTPVLVAAITALTPQDR